MTIRAVLFDVGETLVHPSPSFAALFASVITEQGHPRSETDVAETTMVITRRFSEAAQAGGGWTLTVEGSRTFWVGVYEQMLESLGLPSEDGLREDLYAAFTDLANYALFDDVWPAMGALEAAGLRLAIVSNFEAWLENLLVELGVHESFPVRVISGVEGVEKPDPRIYALALERLGIDASEAVFVGDSPEFDVDPPAALGMATVLIDRRERYPGHEGPRITDLRQLPAQLGVTV
jgi:putative hydrolase of the HAD superfamily